VHHARHVRQRRAQGAFEQVAGKARLMRYGGDCYAYCMLASGLST
jgi:fructose-1,6-bisphosphatase/inositol monophosphatase family enzyme